MALDGCDTQLVEQVEGVTEAQQVLKGEGDDLVAAGIGVERATIIAQGREILGTQKRAPSVQRRDQSSG